MKRYTQADFEKALDAFKGYADDEIVREKSAHKRTMQAFLDQREQIAALADAYHTLSRTLAKERIDAALSAKATTTRMGHVI